MRVRVLYFGVLKDVFGGSGEDVELSEGASVADLIAACRGRYAGVAEVWDSMAVAVNQEYARDVEVLKDGDEVALLPPVSGGTETRGEQIWGSFPFATLEGQDDDSSGGRFVVKDGEREVDAG